MTPRPATRPCYDNNDNNNNHNNNNNNNNNSKMQKQIWDTHSNPDRPPCDIIQRSKAAN